MVGPLRADRRRSARWRMRRRDREIEFARDWGDLSTYNAEVVRGIVHTPEWKAQMTEKQKAYDMWAVGLRT